MWIHECHSKYTKMVKTRSKEQKQPDPKRLEIELSEVKGKQIGFEQLSLIEEGEFWPYPHWWPKLSQEFGEPPMSIPPALRSEEEKKKLVTDLLARTKHIEVVSIVLRFIFPEDFGIISPSVLQLLNLVPAEDYVQQYFRYLSALEKLRDVYRQRSGLKNIADYDMALWTAAHLDLTEKNLLRQMEEDDEFQSIRISNLLEGLGSRWKASIRGRLLLAKALLEQDHAAAAVIVARCYEQLICHIGTISNQEIKIGDKDLGMRKQLKTLAEKRPVVQRGVTFRQLVVLWNLRNDAVHGVRDPDGKSQEIPKPSADSFWKGVEKLRISFKDAISAA